MIHEPLWNSLGQFFVICKLHWLFLGPILSDLQTTLKFFGAFCCDSWWFTNHSEIIFRQFSVICKSLWNFLGDSQWFLVVCKPLSHYFGAILGDLQMTLKFFGVILCDSWTTLNFLGQFSVSHGDSWTTLKLFLGDSWWFIFGGNSENILEWSSMILDDIWGNSWAFLSNSQTTLNFLGWFSVIYKPLWNDSLFSLFVVIFQIAPVASMFNWFVSFHLQELGNTMLHNVCEYEN